MRTLEKRWYSSTSLCIDERGLKVASQSLNRASNETERTHLATQDRNGLVPVLFEHPVFDDARKVFALEGKVDVEVGPPVAEKEVVGRLLVEVLLRLSRMSDQRGQL
jgi:hypothetical protein